MTENEDIEKILYMGVGRSGIDNENSKIAKALNELMQYRAIGTVEEFKALKETNTPKEIEFMHNRSDTVSVWKCHCGNIFLTKHKEGILDGTDVNYCCKCGQKLDWQ